MQLTAAYLTPSEEHCILPTGSCLGMEQKKVKAKPLEETIFSKKLSMKKFGVEKVGRKNYVVWNHKDSNSIHVDTKNSK